MSGWRVLELMRCGHGCMGWEDVVLLLAVQSVRVEKSEGRQQGY